MMLPGIPTTSPALLACLLFLLMQNLMMKKN